MNFKRRILLIYIDCEFIDFVISAQIYTSRCHIDITTKTPLIACTAKRTKNLL